MSESISISRIHFPVTALGPGHRIGIWFQGCSIQCPGCISADTWAHVPGNATVGQLMDAIDSYFQAADGVTITGGEPFEQPAALGELLMDLRKRINSNADVLVYSGFPLSAISPYLSQWDGLIDAVISEPFDINQPENRALMGSDNQRLHMLTSRGRTRFAAYDRPRDARDDRLDAMFDDDGRVWFAGIPRRGDLERLRERVLAEGTVIRTSEHLSR